MPITGQKKVSKESNNGSAHSSPARSPDHLPLHSSTASIRGSTSAPSLTTNNGSTQREDQSTYSSAAPEPPHSQSHQAEERHCTASGGHPLERTSSNSSASSGYSTSSHHHHHHHHHSRLGVPVHHGHTVASVHHQHGTPNWGEKEKVTLLVDSKRFSVSPHLLMKHPNTMLGRMFGSAMDLKRNENGEYEVAKGISASIFRAILEYYRSGIVTCPASESIQEMKEACDYLMIPFNERTIRTNNLCDFLNELSNEGAKQQFEQYVDEHILPVMVHCARKGERECQIVILTEDDVIEWDDQHPPSLGEERMQRVFSTDVYRFFKYFENRDIAKEVLRDKGLKKIRIGIEGYPTNKEKVRVRQTTGRTEVVYNYAQRPFLRMSWEKDEAKSRHVDFTTVKIKTDIAPDAEAATLLSGPEENFDY